MNNSTIERKQIETLLELSDERLYLGLGKLLLAEDAQKGGVLETEAAIEGLYGLQPESILGIIDYGKQFIDDHSLLLRDKICLEWDFCEKRNDPAFSDNVTLVTWVVDAITTLYFHSPLVITTIAVVLVKKGLNTICECS